jgi:RHS repeat-associated protein
MICTIIRVNRSSTDDGTQVYGLDGELLAEANGATGAIQREYLWLPAEEALGAEEEGAAPAVAWPIAMMSGVNTATPSLLSVHADHLGRPIMLTDSTKAQVWQAVYKPFGEIFSSSGAVEQNLRFPGQYFLIETGLAYNWHRFYDPTTGRYTQPDPLRFVDGPSVYGYAGASPLMRVDPTGLQEFLPFPPIFSEPPIIVRPPLPEYPTSPSLPPGSGWEWRGNGPPGGKGGSWWNPEGGSLYPDFNHPPGVSPHWDWKSPNGDWFRWFPDGTLKPKSIPSSPFPGQDGCGGWLA